jgi:hypothetical protein
MFKKYTAFEITTYWTIAVIALGLISGVSADNNASGGEQKLFTYVAYSILIALIGGVIVNIGMIFFSPIRGIKPRLFSLSFIVIVLIFLYPFFEGVVGDQYDEITQTRYSGSEKIETKMEYYATPDSPRIIRSMSFWKNGKKDSVWSTYDRSGKIIKQEKYK